VYFRGEWKTPFDAGATSDELFHLPDGTSKTVPMMSLDELEGAYLSGKSFEGAKLPYHNTTCALWALLPRKGKNPANVLQELDLAKLRAQQNETTVNLQLPRFKIAFADELSDTLQAMGATAAFTFPADFRPMLNQHGAITGVRHKAILEVDEKGTVAAAATEITTNTASAEPEDPQVVTLTFDRPFVLALVEEQSGAAIMLGVVNAPEELKS
jgi:serpin B